MIRSVAILAIILSAFILAVPSTAPGHSTKLAHQTLSSPMTIGDPNATTTAFNYTYSQQNLFTNTTSSPTLPILSPGTAATGTSFKWLGTATETKTNTPIPGTGFNFSLTAPTATGKQTLNWTMIIPEFNCKGCSTVNVEFDFFGNITKQTSANYTLSLTSPPHTQIGSAGSFTTLGSFHANTGNGCPEDVCIDATSYRGYNVTLQFSFGWANLTTAHGMFAELGEVTVASTGSVYQSTGNFMQIDATNSSRVVHTADLSSITFNSTLTTHFHPGNTNITRDWWQTEGINIYYPAGYIFRQAYVNDSIFMPNATEAPLDSRNCVPGAACSQSLLALNVSDYAIAPRNIMITMVMRTDNSISQLQPLSGGTPSTIYGPGDTLGLRTTIRPSVANASISQQTGKLNVLFYDKTNSSHILSGESFPTLTSTGAVYNVTLPSDCSGNNCGLWTVRANFNSSYDLGVMSTTFKIDQLQLATFSTSNGNSGLNIQGTLTNSSGSPAITASGVVFAVDSGSTASYPSAQITNTASVGLYATNVTLVNGVFGQGQSLIMTFTIVNSNSSAPAYNANVTIEHDWPGSPPQPHGLNGNFTLGVGHLGDLSFTRGPQSYQAAFTITGSGILLTITSLSTGNSESVVMSKGSNPVSPTEQHTGEFKITVVTLSGKAVVGSPSSVYSPPYAYVYGLPLSPSSYLAYSSAFTGSTFSTSIKSDSIFGAKKLVVFALARDASGIILSNNSQNPGFTDSTILQSSMDQIGEVSENQQVTAVLHLTSNSTTLSQNITINLNLQNAGVVGTQTGVIIAHGASQSVSLSFTAPSSPGQYTLSFSSPQYNRGVALATQTLKVTIAASNLQILIPALIGVVAAIIVLGVYLIRRKPPTPAEEVTRKSPTGPKSKPTGGGAPASKSLTRTGRTLG